MLCCALPLITNTQHACTTVLGLPTHLYNNITQDYGCVSVIIIERYVIPVKGVQQLPECA